MKIHSDILTDTGTQTARIELAHNQPNADACNAALAAPFHGRTATELRRLYVRTYGTLADVLMGEALVQAVRDTYNAAHA